jgi:7-carboxy-7-deazaguanine synthase
VGYPEDSAIFPVAERFVSVNGEGTHAGQLAAFVRFRGCNLSCSWCDTQWANRADCPVEMLSVAEIVRFADESGARCVTLTGGEPLIQPGIDALLESLSADAERFVEIETNGSVALGRFAALRERLMDVRSERLSFTVDCKLPSSGMASRMCMANYECLDLRDTVKFVIASEDDFGVAAAVIREYNLQQRCRVYLSPAFGVMDPARIVDFMRAEGLDRVRLQLQLHKLIWPDVEKGV